jgi:menaquinone-9 beta-reductase
VPADAVVVGAGPAGAATAILLARQGLAVVLLDRARFPRDKVCGEYLSPEGGRILERLGVLARVEASGARPLRGMRIVGPDGTQLVGDYPPDDARRGDRPRALAVRRRILDAALVERAREVGVSVREGVRAVDLLRDGARVAGVVAEPVGMGRRAGATEAFPAPLVIAADGPPSSRSGSGSGARTRGFIGSRWWPTSRVRRVIPSEARSSSPRPPTRS